jgi:hypothetical protein
VSTIIRIKPARENIPEGQVPNGEKQEKLRPEVEPHHKYA